jgi:catechol 2,3-dioxygenase-like lactoylglutathione lyase family enzyme
VTTETGAGRTATPVGVQRLQHVSLPYPGTPESDDVARDFYAGRLGLDERPRPPALPGVGQWYAVGDQELHLFSEPSGVAANPQSRRHPCFQVDDVVELRRQLVEAGVATQDDDGAIPGRARFFAIDPFGNRLEFVQFAADHW